MASPSVVPDIEALAKSVTETQLPSIPNPPPTATNTADPRPLATADTDPQFQAINTNQDHNGGAPVQRRPDNPQVQRDENHGDASDGLWFMYLTEAEKQDAEVTESWKGDTDGILVFTGLFSATVASFIIESYQNLSPDSSDTTNALLAQISQQLVNMSNGTPLISIPVQSSQSFKPTASAVRVNVYWFLSLILSLSCALSATLMQQWARRYRELAQRRGAFHRRGRMRAFILDGISRFGMARAVATMPTLLHISVFLFFAGLIEFLFPIYMTVAYAVLGCIGVFAVAYAILTVLPNIYLNCPYSTPLSGFTWRITQFSVMGSLWTILEIESLFRKALSKLLSLTNRHVSEPDWLERWRETLEDQVKTRRQWFTQGMRKSVELSAYLADSTVVTNALEWTLTALDEEKEIEDFSARVPGFFDSRVVPDATSAALSLMSHQPNADPIFGSRLYDLLKTCIPGTSLLDDNMRKHRLRVCLNCLWYFGKAYNQPGVSQSLPSYFPNSLIPEITRRVQAEEDPTICVMGRCVLAVIINKLAADLESHTIPLNDGILTCLSAILRIESREVKLLLSQPGAIALANVISFTFVQTGGLVTDTVPSGTRGVVQETLDILSQAISSEESAELQPDQPNAIFQGFYRKFENTLVSRLLDLLNTCSQVTSPLATEVCMSCLGVCLKGLWCIVREFDQLRNSVTLPSYIHVTFANPEMTRYISEPWLQSDRSVSVIGRCVGALVVNKLAADIKLRNILVSNDELECLSAILGTESNHVILLLNHPGAIEFTNILFLALNNFHSITSPRLPSHVLDVVQKTLIALSQALPLELNVKMRLNQILTNISKGSSSLSADTYRSVLLVWTKNLWDFTRQYNDLENSVPLPPYICVAFANTETTRCMSESHDLSIRVTGQCIGALVVNKLTADINSRNIPVSIDELACLSAILGTKTDNVTLLLNHRGAIEFTSVLFIALAHVSSLDCQKVPLDTCHVLQQTLNVLSRALPSELNAKMWLYQTDTFNISGRASFPMTQTTTSVLHVWMKNLWDLTTECNGPGNSVALPSCVCIAFTNPELSRRIRQANYAAYLIGQCIAALVVNKLTCGAMSQTVGDVELACLSAILDIDSHEVRLCLSQPGTIQLVNLASLAFSDVRSSSDHQNVLRIPNARDVRQQTLSIISRALPDRGNDELQRDQILALVDLSADKFKRTCVSHFHSILTTCMPGTSSLIEEVRTSCLRICLKTLWHCAEAYARFSDPMPSYFPLVLASPEIIRQFHTEHDSVSRFTACCFRALVLTKLVDALKSPISLGGGDNNAELACISAILGPEHHEVLLLPYQLRIINLRNVISLMFNEIDMFAAAGRSEDVLNMALDTLSILASHLGDPFFHLTLTADHERLQEGIHWGIFMVLDPLQLKETPVKILEQLWQILEKPLLGVQ